MKGPGMLKSVHNNLEVFGCSHKKRLNIQAPELYTKKYCCFEMGVALECSGLSIQCVATATDSCFMFLGWMESIAQDKIDYWDNVYQCHSG